MIETNVNSRTALKVSKGLSAVTVLTVTCFQQENKESLRDHNWILVL